MAPGFLNTQSITLATQPLNWYTGDILLDKHDLDMMNSGLCVANDPTDPLIANRRSVFYWMDQVGDDLGKDYISSIKRYYKN